MPFRFLAVSLCFLASGFAALLYQTAWTREFAFIFGTSDLALIAVLAGYMGGLAIGAVVAGRWLASISRPLATYALLEGSIGLLALAVPFALRAILWSTRVLFGQLETPPEADDWFVAIFQGGASLAVLILPTALMGATLPLLIRSEVHSDAQVGTRVSLLYAVNTLGAVLGTVAAAFLLLPRVGLRSTVLVGVSINIAVALLALVLSKNEWHGESRAAANREEGEAHEPVGRPHWVIYLMAIAGFTSFTYEVMWTRMLGQLLGGSVYGFATMLAAVLTGITLGSFVAGPLAVHPGRALRAWIVCEIGVALAALASFAALGEVPSWTAGMTRGDWTQEFGALLAAGILLPTTVFIGATFPLAVRVATGVGDDPGVVSARVYSWNTLGGVAGAFVGGYWILPTFGFYSTLSAMIVINAALAVTAAGLASIARVASVAVFASAVAFLVFGPIGEPWKILTYKTLAKKVATEPVEFFEVGRSTNVLVLDTPAGSSLLTGGLRESTAFYVDNMHRSPTAKWLGALPALARPETESLLVVGLGAGIALRSIPTSIERIDVIELEEAVVRANKLMAKKRGYDFRNDPRIRVIINDARGALVRTAFRYDAIVSQPSHPWTAGASHLYTRDFFQLVEDHLSEDGVFVQWIGPAFVDADLLKSLTTSLRDVFGYVRVFRPFPEKNILFLASNAPLPVETTAPSVIAKYASVLRYAGIFSVEDIALSALLLEDEIDAFAEGAPIITDDQNLMQMRSPLIFETSIANSAGTSMNEFDPLVSGQISSPLDLDFAMQRLARFDPRRALRMLDTYPWPSEAAKARAIAVAAHRDAKPTIALDSARKALELGDEKKRSAALIALILQPDVRTGSVDTDTDTDTDIVMAEVMPYLSEAQQFIVESWGPEMAENISRLEDNDDVLASIDIHDPLFESATELRIHWRSHSNRPESLREVVVLHSQRIALYGAVESELALAETFAKLGELHRTRAMIAGAASRMRDAVRRDHDLARRWNAQVEILDASSPDAATQ